MSRHNEEENPVQYDFCATGLPYWRIYRQIPESGDFLKAFGSKFFCLAKCTTCAFARICLHIHM